MNKCLFCEKPIEVIEKKKPKKYCDAKCRLNDFYRRKRIEKLKADIAAEVDLRSNPLINAARGRDESGVNNDELRRNKPKQAPKPQKAIQVPQKEEKPVEPIKIAKPERMKGESGLDYSIRLHEWQERMKQIPL